MTIALAVVIRKVHKCGFDLLAGAGLFNIEGVIVISRCASRWCDQVRISCVPAEHDLHGHRSAVRICGPDVVVVVKDAVRIIKIIGLSVVIVSRIVGRSGCHDGLEVEVMEEMLISRACAVGSLTSLL